MWLVLYVDALYSPLLGDLAVTEGKGDVNQDERSDLISSLSSFLTTRMGCSPSKAHPLEEDPSTARAPQPHQLDSLSREMSDSFVQRQGSQLVLDGQPFRFASLNAPELLDGDCNQKFEVSDTMQTFGMRGAFGGVPVTRTYTLRVSRITHQLALHMLREEKRNGRD